MRIAGIENQSIVDGPGFRYTIFFQGCSHHCHDCQNKASWDFDGGNEQSIGDLLKGVDKAYYIDGITLSGGEPFEQPDEEMLELLKELKNRNLDIIAFTGYTFEQLHKNEKTSKLLPFIDTIVDGKFEASQKSLALRFRGSKNQRVIDVPLSLQQEKIVERNWDEQE